MTLKPIKLITSKKALTWQAIAVMVLLVITILLLILFLSRLGEKSYSLTDYITNIFG